MNNVPVSSPFAHGQTAGGRQALIGRSCEPDGDLNKVEVIDLGQSQPQPDVFMCTARTADTIRLAALLLVAACTTISPHTDSDQADAPTKQVARKADPNYLVARDKSECVVSKERYALVRVGDYVTCSWYFPR
jgi:hypothetical protein